MEKDLDVINQLLVDIFNDILKIEETALKKGDFNDLSVTEVHTMEAIGLHCEGPMNEAAKKLKITVGTLTVAVNNLVKKGYVERSKSEEDRRLVLIRLTKKGRLVYRIHEKFHRDMVKNAVSGINEAEQGVLKAALSNIYAFLEKNMEAGKEREAYGNENY